MARKAHDLRIKLRLSIIIVTLLLIGVTAVQATSLSQPKLKTQLIVAASDSSETNPITELSEAGADFTSTAVLKDPLEFKIVDKFEVSYPGQSDELVISVKNKAPNVAYGVLVDMDIEPENAIDLVSYSSSGGVYLSATEKDHPIGDEDPWDAEFNVGEGKVGEIHVLIKTSISAEPGEIKVKLSFKRDKPFPIDIVMIATNDFEGYARPSWPKFDLGGLSYFMSYVKAVRETIRDGVLLLDAGDTIGAAPLFSGMFNGSSVIDAYNLLGYDAMAIGNHEYDWGLENWLNLMKKAEFEVLSANTYWAETGERVYKPATIISIRGVKVGIIGLTTPETPFITVPKYTEDLKFTDGVWEVNYFARKLKEQGADIIVLLIHYGDVPETNKLLDNLTETVHIVLNGHAGPSRIRTYKGILCEKTEGKGREFARIDLRVDPRTDKILRSKAELVPIRHEVLYEGKLMVKDPEMEKLLRSYEERIEEISSKVVGEAAEDITRDYWRLSELGDLVTDAVVLYFREKVGVNVDFAVQNPGGLRADIPAGPVTFGEVYAALPFPNYYVICEMTGEQVIKLLNDGMGDKGFIQVSGLDFTVNWTAPYGKRVTNVRIHETGEPIDPNAKYLVAANNFIAAGGDKYTTLTEVPQTPYYGIAYRDPLLWYFQQYSPVKPMIEENITIIGTPSGE